MTFDEWVGDRIETMSSHEYAAEKAAWDAAYEQGAEDGLSVAYMAGLKDASSRKLPEGYVLVPVEPTQKMLDAGWLKSTKETHLKISNIYQAMIQAAQEEE